MFSGAKDDFDTVLNKLLAARAETHEKSARESFE